MSHLQVTKILRMHSSRVFDGLAVTRAREGATTFQDSACEPGLEMQSVTHFWQIDDISEIEVEKAIERLHVYLQSQGWEVSDFAFPPEVTHPVVSAKNLGDGYKVWAMGVQDQNRVAVQVSSPCFKLSKGTA